MEITTEQYVTVLFVYVLVLTTTVIFAFRKHAIAAGYDTTEKTYGAKKTRRMFQKFLKSR